MPIPAEQDHADCDNPLIQIAGSDNELHLTVNMNKNPSRLPSAISIHSDRPRDMNNNMNSDIIRITLTFSIAFAPFHIASKVMAITRNWKKITFSGD